MNYKDVERYLEQERVFEQLKAQELAEIELPIDNKVKISIDDIRDLNSMINSQIPITKSG